METFPQGSPVCPHSSFQQQTLSAGPPPRRHPFPQLRLPTGVRLLPSASPSAPPAHPAYTPALLELGLLTLGL